MGWVLAAFYWAYAPMQPVMGWLADRYGPARVLSGGFLLWSLATAANGLAGGLVMLVLLRLLMGVGEATFYPSALSLLSRRVPAAATRTRDRDDAVRRGRRAGDRHAARWADHGSLRMAGDVHRHGPRLAALAHCVAALDAPLAAGPVAGECGRQSALCTDPAAARAVGRHDGDVLLQLCVLFRVLVAAAVPRPRARPLARNDDPGRERVLCRRRRERPAHRLAARPLDPAWRELQSCLQDRAGPEQRGRRRLPDRQQPRERAGRRGRDPAADRRHGRAQQPGQSVRDADVRGSVGDGPLDGHPERRRQRGGYDGARS